MIPLEHLAEEYGYLGLFLASFISSTFIPFSVESLLLLATGLGMRIIEAVGIVTVASTLGGFTTYLIGMSGGKIFGKKIKHDKIEKYKDVVTKGGGPIIFLAAFTPLPYELFSLPAGFLEMDPYAFLLSTAAGRALRFALIGIYGKKTIDIIKSGQWKLSAILIAVALAVIIVTTYITWKTIESKKSTVK